MLDKTPKAVFVGIGFAPIAILFYSLFTFGVNAPHWDDHAIRVFVDKYNLETSGFENFKSIFAYHNEHRIALTRIFSLGIFKYLGFLDFKAMQYLGFVGLIGVWSIFALLIRRFALHPVFYFISALCLFSFSTVENLLWGMASIQNFWIVFLSFASFYILSFSLEEKSKFANIFYYVLAILFAVTALFTSGNGILTPMLALGILILKKDYKFAIAWLITFAIFLFIYFIGYSEIPSKVITINLVAVQAFMMSIASAFFFDEFSISLGNSLLTIIGFLLSVIAIALIFYPFFRAIRYGREKPNGLLFLLSSGLFIAGTLAVVCINRIHYDASIILTSKYKMYSFMAILLIMIYSVYYSKKSLAKMLTAISLIVASFLYFGTYLGYYKYFSVSKAENESFVLNNFNQPSSKTSFKPYPSDIVGILDYQNAPVDNDKIDSIVLGKKEILFFEFDKVSDETELYAIAKSDSNEFFVALGREPINSVSRRIFGYYQDVYRGGLGLLNFPSGIYQMYFLEKRADKLKLINPNKTLRIRGVPYTEDAKNW
ncbi:hypothetical protein SAMN06298216_3259 [Spirosomataceae bacterium TFI 002]|nr:hypothetical protein SAMN06298216_3259 [Spirosomataceae bacterium TFI 002]